MNPQQLLECRQRRIVINKIGIDPLSDQMVIDRCQTLRTFRVMRAHIMQLAVAMGDEGSGCHLFSLCDAASWVALVELALSSYFTSRFKH
jgi:hypothetical protein